MSFSSMSSFAMVRAAFMCGLTLWGSEAMYSVLVKRAVQGVSGVFFDPTL